MVFLFILQIVFFKPLRCPRSMAAPSSVESFYVTWLRSKTSRPYNISKIGTSEIITPKLFETLYPYKAKNGFDAFCIVLVQRVPFQYTILLGKQSIDYRYGIYTAYCVKTSSRFFFVFILWSRGKYLPISVICEY